MRVEAGAVVDEFDLPGVGHVVARHTRTKTPDGGVTWACMFTIATAATSDLAVVHRLSAPSLYEGRRSVRHAVEFLGGRAFGASAATLRDGEHEHEHGADEVGDGAPPGDDDFAWRPPKSRRIYTGRKRPRDRRVALSPSRGHGRRAADQRDAPGSGIVPDLSLFSGRGANGEPGADADADPARGVHHSDDGDPREQSPGPWRDPEPSPLR